MGSHKRYNSHGGNSSSGMPGAGAPCVKKSPLKKLFTLPLAKAKGRLHRRSRSEPFGGGVSQDGGQTESSTRVDERLQSEPVTPRLNESTSGTSRTVPVSNLTAVNIDDGVPSQSALKDLQRVLKLIEDERHLVAYDLYVDARQRIHDSKKQKEKESSSKKHHKKASMDSLGCSIWGSTAGSKQPKSSVHKENGEDQAEIVLLEKQDEFQALENRAQMFIKAKQNLSFDDDWIFAQNLFGITTYYRREGDESLSVKIEGELHGVPLFEQMVVLREVDLYCTWAPFMQKSKKLAQLGKLDVVAWYLSGIPMVGLTRDVCYRAVGCDCMKEDGSMLLVAVGLNDKLEDGTRDTINNQSLAELTGSGKMPQITSGPRQGLNYINNKVGTSHVPLEKTSVNDQSREQSHIKSCLSDTTHTSFLTRDEILDTIEIPPIPCGIGHGRMSIRNFVASIDVLGPSSARTKMVVNVDPNLNLIPQSLIDFCMKRMCGVLLSRLQATARKVVKDPVKSPHSRRMREDVRFYRDWLLPKFRLYCDELGWTMPPVGALSVSEEDVESEGIFEGWRADSSMASDSTQQLEGDENTVVFMRESSNSSTCSSGSSHKHRLGKLGHLFREQELKASAKREQKILIARQKAAERLKPEPFSVSKRRRLKELKNAKMRAEERSQAKSLSSSSASISLSSYMSMKESICSQNSGVDWVEEDMSKRDILPLFSSLLLNLLFLPLQPYAALSTPIPYFQQSLSDKAIFALQDSMAILMVGLQAVSLWSLLNSALIFAFEFIDFGQKELVGNLDHGKKFYVNSIRTFSFFLSVSVFASSIGLALSSFIFERSINGLCILRSGDLWHHVYNWALKLWRAGVYERFSTLNIDLQVIAIARKAFTSLSVFLNEMNLRMLSSEIFHGISRILSRINSSVPESLKNKSLVSNSIFLKTGKMFFSQPLLCESQDVAAATWRRRALGISSFISLRIGCFILALVLVAKVLLPKPKKQPVKVANSTSASDQHYLLSKSVPLHIGKGYADAVSPMSKQCADGGGNRPFAYSVPINVTNSNSMDVINEE